MELLDINSISMLSQLITIPNLGFHSFNFNFDVHSPLDEMNESYYLIHLESLP